MVAQGRSMFLSEPPPPKDGQFLHKGVGFLNQKNCQKMNPSERPSKGSGIDIILTSSVSSL